MSQPFISSISDDLFQSYLQSGSWSETADDDIVGETVSDDTIRQIVEAYNSSPASEAAGQALGLLALMLGVAEWGVKWSAGSDTPGDPADKYWKSDTGEDSGKHLMSYAVGGVGISHADVGDLEEYVRWVAKESAVPAVQKMLLAPHAHALLRLADIKYGKPGMVYDELRAAGVCVGGPVGEDLLSEPFRHFKGPSGSKYCIDYENGALTEQDWVIFRTWMRASLRTSRAQRYLLDLWLRDYWRPTTEQVEPGDGAAEEMIVNVRIRNSAPAVARAATTRPAQTAGVKGRVQRQIDAYADWKLKTARRRWKIMMRPVTLYRHFSGKSQLDGLSCK